MMSLSAGALATMVATSAIAQQAVDGRYSSEMFREAVLNRRNTSQPFVLVTIIDASSGVEKEGYTEIGALAASIALQEGWTRDYPRPTEDELDSLLLRTVRRRFAFYQARWLAGSGYYSTERSERACILLRRGIPAFRADLTGQIVAGTPSHPLMGDPSQNGS